MGQTLGYRNDEWVNGTMPGLCIALCGSNSDVKPNDRLPITADTHESICHKRCVVKKHNLKRTTRITQRAQNIANGYFGGYIGKRQPGRSLETKKCVDKLFSLRAKMRGCGKAAQVRAASGRLITDLDMNSSFRTAVEISNLTRNLHPHDVLFAECIRTFGSMVIDGRSWMYRLESTQSATDLQQECLQNYVPPSRRPNVRSDKARANYFEIYGYRPLQFPWQFLRPYDCLQYWRAEPLLIPNYYDNRGLPPRTEWTAEGNVFRRSAEYKAGEVVAKPGIHYLALDNEHADADYVLFPEHPLHFCSFFRHSWVLVRKTRPDVIVIGGLKKT